MKKFFYVFIVLCMASLYLKADFLDIQRQEALKHKQLILLSIEKEGCPYCLKMHTEIFNVPKYSQYISKKYLHVSMRQEDPSLPKAYHVKYFPTNLIVSSHDLHIIDEFAGYMNPESFIELLDEVYPQEIKYFIILDISVVTTVAKSNRNPTINQGFAPKNNKKKSVFNNSMTYH